MNQYHRMWLGWQSLSPELFEHRPRACDMCRTTQSNAQRIALISTCALCVLMSFSHPSNFRPLPSFSSKVGEKLAINGFCVCILSSNTKSIPMPGNPVSPPGIGTDASMNVQTVEGFATHLTVKGKAATVKSCKLTFQYDRIVRPMGCHHDHGGARQQGLWLSKPQM